MTEANLQYSITLARLWGTIGTTHISINAVSGGRAGSTNANAVDHVVANNVLKMGQKTNHAKGIHGGPLPIGRYTISAAAQHPHLGLSARLTPTTGGLTFGMLDRSGFLIHGRGSHGSDGCIVPVTAAEFQRLMKELKAISGGELTVWP